MSSFLSKHDKWLLETCFIKSFRTENTALKYMKDRPKENWKQITVFPEKAYEVFGCDFDEYENNKFFKNNLGQHIQLEVGQLFNISLEEYVAKSNIEDYDEHPIIINFFKEYQDEPVRISKLFDEACNAFGFKNLQKKADIKKVNKWIIEHMEAEMHPIFYQEKYLAYLMVIIGELILRNKLTDYNWYVDKMKLDTRNDDAKIQSIYAPYLCNNEGKKLEIRVAFQEYLFMSAGNVRNVFTNVYNNIEKYNYYDRRPELINISEIHKQILINVWSELEK